MWAGLGTVALFAAFWLALAIWGRVTSGHRWKVWRQKNRLINYHLDSGYRLHAHHEALYRDEAERMVTAQETLALLKRMSDARARDDLWRVR